MTADRARRFATWAAAVARAPVATPPTVPWQPGGAPRFGAPGGDSPAGAHWADAGPAGVGGAGAIRTGGGARLAEVARRELTDLVAAGREALAEAVAGDPARKHANRLRRARRRLRSEATVATGFAVVTASAVVAPGLEAAEYGFGTAAIVTAVAALRTRGRLGRLRRQPVPAARVPRSSPARGPLDRLAERERALHGLLAHLGDAADDPRRVAATAAHRLRELGARLTAVERAHRAAGGLDAAVAGLHARLTAGVDAYAALVVAAADAVAADAGLHHLPQLEDATEALAALAAGLRDVTAA